MTERLFVSWAERLAAQTIIKLSTELDRPIRDSTRRIAAAQLVHDADDPAKPYEVDLRSPSVTA